ncbi:MAG: SDR family oxidoreductase [Myxococcales bacterium]|nr:SDR family oxidoreductase [Myxococcales bacterium]
MARVLVTGGNRGIGLELCRQLAARGDQVVAVCRKPSTELSALGVRVEAGLDVTAPEAGFELHRRLAGQRLDVVIQNAGVLSHESLPTIDVAAIRRQLEVNAIAPLVLTAALRPLLEKGSKVALVTSRMGSMADNGSGGYYGYRMSKAALNAAGVSLARDLAPSGIAVVLLHPGFVRTGMTGGAGSTDPDEAARGLLARIDALDLSTSGKFLHANGEELPF